MSEIWIAAVATVASGAMAQNGAKKAGAAAQRGADAATAESSRQFDLARQDTAPGRNIGNSAMDTIARLYRWATPSQAFNREAALQPSHHGDADVPQGSTVVNKGGGNYDVMYNGVRIGGLSKGGAAGHFTPAQGVDVGALITQQQQAEQARQSQGGAATGTGRPDMGAFFESPDYQFNLAEGQKAIDRSLASRGRALSGAGVKEGTRYASGMASNEYSNFLNRLTTIAGLGNAAVNTSVGAGLTTAGQIGAAQQNAGNARASAYMAGANGMNNAVQGGISNYMLQRYLQGGSVGTPPYAGTQAGRGTGVSNYPGMG
jgi:hypothetical protein